MPNSSSREANNRSPYAPSYRAKRTPCSVRKRVVFVHSGATNDLEATRKLRLIAGEAPFEPFAQYDLRKPMRYTVG